MKGKKLSVCYIEKKLIEQAKAQIAQGSEEPAQKTKGEKQAQKKQKKESSDSEEEQEE